VLLALLLLCCATPALADSLMPADALANTQLADPVKERAAKGLMETIRCLVCQGQSIADSDADMAADMRALIRQRVAAGEEPEAIRAWLVERYGNWVSYEPPVSTLTGPLYALPLLALFAGIWLIRGRLRGRKK
jgi:cytochrome c-type biogenesis protein CcmH